MNYSCIIKKEVKYLICYDDDDIHNFIYKL